MKLILSHKESDVYKLAYRLAMDIFHLSKKFTVEERYSLTDQIRQSSGSAATNTAEEFRKRRHAKAFAAKLSDAELEAAEAQTWLDFARDCGCVSIENCSQDNHNY